MAKSFEPHLYASALRSCGDMASESRMLCLWKGSHWQILDDEDAEIAAYHWLVKFERFATYTVQARQFCRAKPEPPL